MSYIDAIRQKYNGMSSSFRSISYFIVNSFVDASFMSAGELAATLNLDAATIVRFSQFIGYKGFPQLHREIQERVKRELSRRSNLDQYIKVEQSIPCPYEEKINHKRNQMSKSFLLVADCLLHDFVNVSFMSAGELAKSLNLDAASIVRFSQFLGYRGYPELHREVCDRAKVVISRQLNIIDTDQKRKIKNVITKQEETKKNIAVNEILTKRIFANNDISWQQKILIQQVDAIRNYLTGKNLSTVSSEKLCDWVQFCYTFELYTEACELFSLINESEVNSWYFARTKKFARLCAMRIQGMQP